MTALDQNTPIPAKSLAAIQERNERALKCAEDPAWSLDQAEFDRAMLCAEVDRLTSERDKAKDAARTMGRCIDVTALEIRRAARLANAGDVAAAWDVIAEYADEADWLDNLDDDDNFDRPSATTTEQQGGRK